VPVTEALPEGRLAYRVDEVANLLGISTDTVYELTQSGQLRSTKAGRRTLISAKALDEFLGDS
jgi:excisionase family DNA binding protein